MLRRKAGKDSMPEEIKNARDYPKVFYARHMESGLCGYENENILVDADAMKRMAPSFAGKPVYVQHQDVNLDKIKHEADGYVADCFYNELDGWLWSKIIVVSDEGNDAVGKGWKVSNAYVPLEWGGAGSHHNVDFKRKIVNAGFTHLAIVPDPRYENAEIYTPDQYKSYCETKRIELDELRNSKGKNKMAFKFFKNKKEEVQHDQVDDDTMVELQNGKSISVKDLNAALAAADADPAAAKLAADIKRYEELQNKKSKSKKNAEGQEEEEKVEEDGEEKINAEDECTYKGKSMKVGDLANRMKKNSETDDEKKEREEKENAESEEEKKNARHFEELKNARNRTAEIIPVDLDVDQLARGQSRYGTATK